MGCGLRREIEDMLSFIQGKWKLRLSKLSVTASFRLKYKYVIAPAYNPFYDPAVAGYGGSKKAALANLLENWRRGGKFIQLECPAASREELRIKLAIRGDQT